MRKLTQIKQIVIHCSATPNGRPTTIEDIDRWHQERGFEREEQALQHHQPHLKAIGYHYFIDTAGKEQKGRALEEVGAHCYGINKTSLGICIAGTDQFSKTQWRLLHNRLTVLESTLPNLESIIGHNEYNTQKTCPGFSVTDYLYNAKQPYPENILQAKDVSTTLTPPQKETTTMATIALTEDQFYQIIADRDMQSSERTMLSQEQINNIATGLNKKINIPFFFTEQKEHVILAKMVMKIDTALYNNLPNEVYGAIHSVADGIDQADFTGLAKNLTRLVNKKIDIPYVPEFIEAKIIGYVVGVLVYSMQKTKVVTTAVDDFNDFFEETNDDAEEDYMW